jgi:RNA polymerase sigma factor (TIGR02999 family)
MPDITYILGEIEAGKAGAAEALLGLVYDELRALAALRMTSERLDHTLQGTALVHEAYIRLVDAKETPRWENRRHFFAAAAEAMRRVLVDHAREHVTEKRGGCHQRIHMDDFSAETPTDPALLLDLNESLSKLSEEDPEAAEFVKLRLFAGLSVTEAGQMLGMSRTVAYRNWDFVRSWFTLQTKRSAD